MQDLRCFICSSPGLLEVKEAFGTGPLKYQYLTRDHPISRYDDLWFLTFMPLEALTSSCDRGNDASSADLEERDSLPTMVQNAFAQEEGECRRQCEVDDEIQLFPVRRQKMGEDERTTTAPTEP